MQQAPQIIPAGREVEWLVTGFQATDGPAFSRLGYLLFTDVAANRIQRFTDEEGPQTVREHTNGAAGLTFDRQGRILLCESAAARVTRIEKNGSITVLAAKFDGKPLGAPDDIVHAIDGSAYFTDPPAGRVYQVTPAGRLRVATAELARPTGIALSANQQTLYVADGERGHVRAYGIEADGALARGRIAAEVKTPNGIKTDEAGNLYSTTTGGVWVFSPAGKLIATIGVAGKPSNLAWGDDFRVLYITGGESLHRIRLNATGTRTF